MPEEVTLTTSFLNFTKNDWVGSILINYKKYLKKINYANTRIFCYIQTNGVIVVSADQLAVPDDHHENYLPKYLLYKKVLCYLEI